MQFGVCAAKFITHAKNINNELGNFQALTHRIFAVTFGFQEIWQMHKRIIDSYSTIRLTIFIERNDRNDKLG